jgi:hypothetical protein
LTIASCRGSNLRHRQRPQAGRPAQVGRQGRRSHDDVICGVEPTQQLVCVDRASGADRRHQLPRQLLHTTANATHDDVKHVHGRASVHSSTCACNQAGAAVCIDASLLMIRSEDDPNRMVGESQPLPRFFSRDIHWPLAYAPPARPGGGAAPPPAARRPGSPSAATRVNHDSQSR